MRKDMKKIKKRISKNKEITEPTVYEKKQKALKEAMLEEKRALDRAVTRRFVTKDSIILNENGEIIHEP